MVCLRQALVYNAGENDKMENLKNIMIVSAFYGGDSLVDKGIRLKWWAKTIQLTLHVPIRCTATGFSCVVTTQTSTIFYC